MYIIEKKTKYGDGGKVYKYCKLVETVMTTEGPRQRILLHLGQLNVPKDKLKALARLIEIRLAG